MFWFENVILPIVMIIGMAGGGIEISTRMHRAWMKKSWRSSAKIVLRIASSSAPITVTHTP